MGVLNSTDWTGTNGDAWPSPWTTSSYGGGSGHAEDIQSNTGRLLTASSGGGVDDSALAILTGVSHTQIDLVCSFKLHSDLSNFHSYSVFTRASGDWASGFLPTSGYRWRFSNVGSIQLRRMDSGSSTTLITGTAKTINPSETWWIRVHNIGTTIRCRWWLDGTSEPSTWDIDTTDSNHSSGVVQISNQSTVANAAVDSRWDNLVITDGSMTASPAAAALVLAQPAVSPSAGSSSSPAVAALVLAQPAVTASNATNATSSPAVAATVLAQPAVDADGNAVVFRSAASAGTTAAASTGVVCNKPAGVADGDVLYAFVSKTTYADTNPFTCSGWTEVTSGTRGTISGNDRHLCVLRKVITNAAGEPSTYTFVTTSATSSQMCATIICISGADTTTPEDITVPAVAFITNDATPVSQNATSATAGALALAGVQLSLATTATKTMVAPTGYTLDANATTTATSGSLDNQQAVAYKSLGAAGSTTGTNAWLNTADDATTEAATVVVLIRPKLSSAQPTPATAALVAAQPAVTASAGTNATASPSVAATVLAQPAVTASGAATPAPAAAALIMAQPAVTATGAASPAPATAALVVAQPAVTATPATLLADDFTGTDGGAWDTGKWTNASYTGGSSTIQTNKGRLTTTSTTGSGGSVVSVASFTAGSYDVTFTGAYVTGGDASTTGFSFIFNVGLSTGYLFHFLSGSQSLVSDRSIWTQIATSSDSISVGTTYNFRIQHAGSLFRAKWWTGTEPGTWNLEASGLSGASIDGVICLDLYQTASTATSFDIDDFSMTTVLADATPSPATAATVVAQPAVSPQAGATSSPAVAATIMAQPVVTAGVSMSGSPSVAALVLAQPAASPSAGATSSPAVAATVMTQPAVTAGVSVDASPAAAALVLAQPAVTPSAGATGSPATAATVLAQPAVTATAGAGDTASPGTTALILDSPAVAAQAGATSSPATNTLVLAQPPVTPSAGATGSPDTTATVIAQPAVSTSAGSSSSPATAGLVVAQPAVSPQAGATSSPAAAPFVVAVPAVTVEAGSTPSPTTAALVVAVPDPSLSAGATAYPDTVTLLLAILDVTATGNVVVIVVGVAVTHRERTHTATYAEASYTASHRERSYTVTYAEPKHSATHRERSQTTSHQEYAT